MHTPADQVEFLLERGVDPDVRARGGDETALVVAARRGQRLHLGVAAVLVRAGASIVARDVSVLWCVVLSLFCFETAVILFIYFAIRLWSRVQTDNPGSV